MTGIASGIASQLCAVPEATWGVAPALTSAVFYEFKSETLKLNKKTVQGQGLHGGGLHDRASRRVISYYDAAGGITMDLPSQGLNQLLYQMFGSFGQTKAALAEDGTTGAYSSTHAPGSTFGHGMCWQKGVPTVDTATVEPFTYVGGKLTDWTVSCQLGALAELQMTWDFRNELAGAGNGDPNNGTIPGLQAFTEPTTNSVFHFREATLLTGGTPTTASGVTSISGASVAGNVKSANIKYAFSLDTQRIFLGSQGFKAEQIENNFRKISGDFEVEWLSTQAMYNAYAADTPTALQLEFIGPGIGTGSDKSSLILMIPQVRFDDGSPQVPGPAVVTQKIPFTGLDDGTNNAIQATYVTLDSV